VTTDRRSKQALAEAVKTLIEALTGMPSTGSGPTIP